MKKLLLLLIIPFLSFGQEFHKQYFGTINSSEKGFYFEQTEDQGYIIVGGTTATGGGWNSYIIKTDSSGEIIWENIIEKSGVGDNDWATCVIELNNGDFVLAGVIYSTGYTVPILSLDDCEEWYNEMGYSLPQGVVPCATQVTRIPYLMKINANGDEIWTKLYNEMPSVFHGNTDVIRFIKQTDEGGYFLVGTNQSNNNTSIYNSCQQVVMKVDQNGYQIFDSYICSGPDIDGDNISNSYDYFYGSGMPTYPALLSTNFGEAGFCQLFENLDGDGSGDNIYFNSVLPTSSGGLIFCGQGKFENSLNKGWEGVVVQLNENGEVDWFNNYGGWNNDKFLGIENADDGGYILVGTTESYDVGDIGDPLLYICKINASGEEEWVKTYGDGIGQFSLGQSGILIEKSSDNNYFILANGFYPNALAGSNIFDGTITSLLKINNDGDTLWSERFKGHWLANSWYYYHNPNESLPENYHPIGNWNGILDFKATSDGGFLIGGTTSDGNYYQYQGAGDTNDGNWTYWNNPQSCNFPYLSITGNNESNIAITKYNATGETVDIIENNMINYPKNWLKTIDILGREITNKKGFQLHIYDNGSVEKKYIVE